MVSEFTRRCDEEGRRSQQFLLLAMIDGEGRAGKSRRAAATDLDKSEAIGMQHDQVDLAAAAAEISGDGFQALSQEETLRQLFGPVA